MNRKLRDSDDLSYWLALNRAPQVGNILFARLIGRFGGPRAVFEADPSEWRRAGLGDQAIAFLQQPDWPAVEADLRWVEAAGHHCLRLDEPAYPALLKEIVDPPPLLFVSGVPDGLSVPHVAMVGSRNPSPGGLRAADDLARSLVAAGLGIVSGMALGIDAACHRGALGANGLTLAVMGTGPDLVYPRQHWTLAESIIAAGGALVTEFPPGTAPKAPNFPRRNRIISGLALGTLVVEAAERSGSLITARLAAEQNREVFAVPGSIYSPLAQGCNNLIKQGAKLVQSVADVLEELRLDRRPVVPLGAPPNVEETDLSSPPLLKYIAHDPTSVDTLVAATGETAESITGQLLLLELQGRIAPAPGGGYVRIG